MDRIIEKEIKKMVRPLLKKSRPGDWEHTLRAVDYGKRLLESEDGDPQIVIPSLYLHDTGWSKVDYSDFFNAPPGKRVETYSFRRHMKYGAEIASDILGQLTFDRKLIDRIVKIISIHDFPDQVFALNDISATLVVESDRLDRYGTESNKREPYRKELFSDPEYINFRRNGMTD